MLTRRRPAVDRRGMWFWLYVRAVVAAIVPPSHAARAFSLQLIEHLRQRVLDLQGLLDLVRGHVRVLAILHEARALVLAHELDERLAVRLPVRREALEVLEHRIDTGLAEEGHRVLGVLVEVGV